jgi:hypothetical protein
LSKSNAQMVELVQPILTDGEELQSTGRFNYNGTLPGNALSIDASISAVDAAAHALEADPALVVAFPTANQIALALTNRRIFVWSLGMSGKPKQFLGEVPLGALAKVRSGGAGFGAQLHLTMRSGAIVDIEFMRGEPADEFTEALLAATEG